MNSYVGTYSLEGEQTHTHTPHGQKHFQKPDASVAALLV